MILIVLLVPVVQENHHNVSSMATLDAVYLAVMLEDATVMPFATILEIAVMELM